MNLSHMGSESSFCFSVTLTGLQFHFRGLRSLQFAKEKILVNQDLKLLFSFCLEKRQIPILLFYINIIFQLSESINMGCIALDTALWNDAPGRHKQNIQDIFRKNKFLFDFDSTEFVERKAMKNHPLKISDCEVSIEMN
ncbi:hypothetical protein ACOSP7_006640 [Xanthoceras sorbifolium]